MVFVVFYVLFLSESPSFPVSFQFPDQIISFKCCCSHYCSVRFYIMKTLGCISKHQLSRFRELFGATEDGETFPLVDIYRPIQPVGDRVVYECGTNGLVDYCDDSSSSDESDSSGGSDSDSSDSSEPKKKRKKKKKKKWGRMEITDEVTESANFKWIIGSIAGLVGLICIAVIGGGCHYRQKVMRSKKKLSDHIQLETAVVPEEDSDDDIESIDGDKVTELTEIHGSLK